MKAAPGQIRAAVFILAAVAVILSASARCESILKKTEEKAERERVVIQSRLISELGCLEAELDSIYLSLSLQAEPQPASRAVSHIDAAELFFSLTDADAAFQADFGVFLHDVRECVSDGDRECLPSALAFAGELLTYYRTGARGSPPVYDRAGTPADTAPNLSDNAERITAEDAAHRSAKLFGSEIKPTGRLRGDRYFFACENSYAELSAYDGRLLRYVCEHFHSDSGTVISDAAAAGIASAFAADNGCADMAVYETVSRNGMVIVRLCAYADCGLGWVMLTDAAVTAAVATDSGRIRLYDATGIEPDAEPPVFGQTVLSREDAGASPGDLLVYSESLGLCYLTGRDTGDGGRALIRISAETGRIVKAERLP